MTEKEAIPSKNGRIGRAACHTAAQTRSPRAREGTRCMRARAAHSGSTQRPAAPRYRRASGPPLAPCSWSWASGPCAPRRRRMAPRLVPMRAARAGRPTQSERAAARAICGDISMLGREELIEGAGDGNQGHLPPRRRIAAIPVASSCSVRWRKRCQRERRAPNNSVRRLSAGHRRQAL